MAFLGLGKKKKKQLPPLGMPPKSLSQKLPDLPPLPELPPLPSIPPDAHELKPSMEIGQHSPEPIKEKPIEPMKKEQFGLKMPDLPELPPLPDLPPLPIIEDEKPTIEVPGTKVEVREPRKKRDKKLVPLPVLDKTEYSHPGLKSLFVKGDDYKSIISGINAVKNRIKDAETIFEDLQSLKKEKEKNLTAWQNLLEDIQKKLVYVDKKVFKT